MILEILWCPNFTPLVILLGGVKMGHVSILPWLCPFSTPNFRVKTGHLLK